MVDTTRLELLETDSTHFAVGEATKQATGPFNAGSFKSQFAAVLSGSNAGRPASLGTILTLDGTSAATAMLDSNINGNPQSSAALTGNYTVTDAATGRTELTLSGNGASYKFVFYPVTNGNLKVAEVDTIVAAGTIFAQQSSAFSNASISGRFAASLQGIAFDSNGTEAAVGQILPNGGGAISGILDINDNGTLALGSSLAGTYSVAQSGRTTGMLSTPSTAFSSASIVLYVVDQAHALLIEVDSNRVLAADLEKQY